MPVAPVLLRWLHACAIKRKRDAFASSSTFTRALEVKQSGGLFQDHRLQSNSMVQAFGYYTRVLEAKRSGGPFWSPRQQRCSGGSADSSALKQKRDAFASLFRFIRALEDSNPRPFGP